jgi:hypothetical protein
MKPPSPSLCLLAGALGLALEACTSDPELAPEAADTPRDAVPASSGPPDAGQRPPDAEANPELPGTALQLELKAGTPVYVRLDQPSQLDANEADTAGSWDLKFDGLEIFTNSGPSGPGQGGAFGPDDELNLLFEGAPEVPFLREDEPGGAFLGWYAYDGQSHGLWSRFHTYALRATDGNSFKVQIVSYYGEEAGAPVSALYAVRYARVTPGASSPVQIASGINGTALPVSTGEESPSGCVNLITGDTVLLTPAAAQLSHDWHLCFRRESIFVNGGVSGPAGVLAADLNSARAAEESLDEIKQLTSDSQLEAFEAVTYETLTSPDLRYRADGVVSAFTDRWHQLDAAGDPQAIPASWFVRGADGVSHYVIVLRNLEATGADGTLRVELRVRPVTL